MLAAIVGVVTSAVAWGFLELIYQIQQGVYIHLPQELGFSGTPEWWSLPVLGIAGLITALAIVRLPGTGGHIPADGLNASPTQPIELPGVILAALASIGLGAVIGPEAPLIALAGALGSWPSACSEETRLPISASCSQPPPPSRRSRSCSAHRSSRRCFDRGGRVGWPEAAAGPDPRPDGGRDRVPVSIGLGQWTGLSTTHISIGVLPLAPFARPDLTDFAWTIPFAAVIAARHRADLPPRQGGGACGELTALPRCFRPPDSPSPAWPSHSRRLRKETPAKCSSPDRRPCPRLWRRRRVVVLRPRPSDRLQGAGLRDLARQLQGRPGVPGDVPRQRCRPDGWAATGLRGRRRRSPSGSGRRSWPSSGCRCRPSSWRSVLTSKAGLRRAR